VKQEESVPVSAQVAEPAGSRLLKLVEESKTTETTE